MKTETWLIVSRRCFCCCYRCCRSWCLFAFSRRWAVCVCLCVCVLEEVFRFVSKKKTQTCSEMIKFSEWGSSGSVIADRWHHTWRDEQVRMSSECYRSDADLTTRTNFCTCKLSSSWRIVLFPPVITVNVLCRKYTADWHRLMEEFGCVLGADLRCWKFCVLVFSSVEQLYTRSKQPHVVAKNSWNNNHSHHTSGTAHMFSAY